MIWKALSYLNYRLKARGRHGTHSPFVYDFVDKCLRLQVDKEIIKTYKNYIHSLRSNHSVIEINDQGAGSKKLGSKRKIADIAKISSTSFKYGKLLFKISAYYQPKKTLELGTSLGIGTFMLASGNLNGVVTTVDACKNTQNTAKQQLKSFGVKNVQFINSTFVEWLKGDTIIYDLIFIDGDHRGEKLLELMTLLDKNSHDETLFVLDDIRWTKDMFATWISLTNSHNYHLTIDLHRVGLIAKRQHQQKNRFIIKI